MAGSKAFGGGGSELAAVLRREGVSVQAIEALMAPGAANGFHGSRSMLNFADIRREVPDHPYFHRTDLEESAAEAADDDTDDCFQQPPEKKRRLSATQVESLERSFETENKLEPKRKVQLATDLGLQPRQVAIWFQNRRARWKTKQLEKDYAELKLQYHSLRDDYDELLREKEKLKAEVAVLTERLLVVENGKGDSSNLFELANQSSPVPEANYLDSTSDEEKLPVPGLAAAAAAAAAPGGGKQEEVCSADSAALVGSESSLYAAEPVDSSAVLEWDHSDVSRTEDDEEEGDEARRRFPNLGDGSCSYGLRVEEGEEQAFWFWPY